MTERNLIEKLSQTYSDKLEPTPKQVYDQIHQGEKFDEKAVDNYQPTPNDIGVKDD